MKRAVAILLLLCFSSLCCFAEESLESDKDHQTMSVSSELSLPLFNSSDGFFGKTSSINNPMNYPTQGIGTLKFGQTNLKLTKYSGGGGGATDAGIIVGTILGTVLGGLLLASLILLAVGE
ncbi:hypothetical protein [Treponema sp. R80B11-R83G3]